MTYEEMAREEGRSYLFDQAHDDMEHDLYKALKGVWMRYRQKDLEPEVVYGLMAESVDEALDRLEEDDPC